MLTKTSKKILVEGVTLLVLDIIAVALRLWARQIKRQRLGTDDVFAILALICLICSAIVFIWGAADGGLGHHVNDLSMDTIALFLKIQFALQFPYLLSVTFIKLSILFFYERVFPLPTFTTATRCMCVFVILWFITFFFATLFQCWPISGNWQLGNAADTINQYAMYAAATILESLADIVTLTIPIFVVWTMRHLSTRKKVMVTLLFLLGAFVCFASIMRLYYIVKYMGPNAKDDIDLTYNLADLVVWSGVEPPLGLICVCLPTLSPVFRDRKYPIVFVELRDFLRSKFSGEDKSDNNESGHVLRPGDKNEP
ncbi:hypothetical protein CC78DRAFT_620564 [Lojkania enalia]|uniref:Rhodopsin domain-containing protein n=1 Tax=Lojkania enalia TaxID=147567 RepID=A0A9P4MZ90_9PLEO|nr:hypothetical protein CC78DRAFT_620564 [Didymosphaeria enalia]